MTWIVFGFNTYNPDYKLYEFLYDTYYLNYSNANEIGFVVLCRMFKSLGFSFLEFRAIISFILLSVFCKCLFDYTVSPIIAYISYIFYPFLINVIQIRSFIAEVIILFSIRYLKDFKRGNLIKFSICLVLSITFHSTAIAYSVLLLAYCKKLNTVWKISCISISVMLYIRIFNFKIFEILIRSLTFMGENFYNGFVYLDYTNSRYKLMTSYFLIGGSLLILYIYRFYDSKIFSKNLERIMIDDEFGMKLLLISLIFIPFFSFGPSFGRLYHSFIPVIYCIELNCVAIEGKMLKIKNFFIKSYVLFLSSILFYQHIVTGEPDVYQRVFKSILDNNLIFYNMNQIIK